MCNNNKKERNANEAKRLDKKLEAAGFVFERHGRNHDIYRRGNETEKVPRHKKVNENLAKMILRKWKLSLEESYEMARDAIGLSGISMEDQKEEIPIPSDHDTAIEKVQLDTEIVDFSKGILTYVDVDFSEYRKKVDTKTVRRNVALPSWLNYEAEHAGINVSRVLQEALMNVLNVKRNEAAGRR